MVAKALALRDGGHMSAARYEDNAPPWEPPDERVLVANADPEAARLLNERPLPKLPSTPALHGGQEIPTGWAGEPIKWGEFWSTEVAAPEYVIEPLFAKGRQTAIFSTAKTGKSLLVLDMVAAAVTGRSVLGQPPGDPVRVV